MKKEVLDVQANIEIDELNAQSAGTLMESLGIHYTHVSKERVEATMPVDKRNRQPFGVLHGGATLALAETVAGIGSLAICKEDETAVGMQVSGNHVSPAKEGETVLAIATPIHIGHRTHVWSVDVKGKDGKLVSSIRVVNAILKKRKD